MKNTSNKYLIIFIFVIICMISGCSGEEAQPPSTALPDGGVTSGEDAGGGEEDAEVYDAEADAPSDAACTFDGSCWTCAAGQRPADQEQLLNACTPVQGVRFDNAARLPLLNDDGSLPPLP